MTPIWMANAHAHFDMTEDELAEAGMPRAMVRPDVEPFEPVAHYPGTAALMLIAMCFTIPLAIYGAGHLRRYPRGAGGDDVAAGGVVMSFWKWFMGNGYVERPTVNDVTPAEAVAESIAQAFRSDDVQSDLDSFGISSMSVIWRGTKVEAKWFSSGSPYELIIGNDSSFPSGYAKVIFRAAIARANSLTNERISRLAEGLQK